MDTSMSGEMAVSLGRWGKWDMSDLIERARLTSTEKTPLAHAAVEKNRGNHSDAWAYDMADAFADTQLRKALLVVTEWLGEQKLIGEEPSAELVALFRELHPEGSVHENVEVI